MLTNQKALQYGWGLILLAFMAFVRRRTTSPDRARPEWIAHPLAFLAAGGGLAGLFVLVLGLLGGLP